MRGIVINDHLHFKCMYTMILLTIIETLFNLTNKIGININLYNLKVLLLSQPSTSSHPMVLYSISNRPKCAGIATRASQYLNFTIFKL